MEHKIKELILKLSRGTCNEEEIDLLLKYFNSPDHKSLEKEMKMQWDSNDFVPASKDKVDEIWNKLKPITEAQSIKDNERGSGKRKRGSWRHIYKYAAIFIGIIMVSVFVFKDEFTRNEQINTITVEFSDGKIEQLDTGAIDLLKNPGLVLEKDVLRYDSGSSTSEVMEFHTIRIPYGKKFQVVLSDGTEVHLNSGTTLKYPVKFIEGKQRIVHLKGEAFFKVAKDEDRFLVNTAELNTEVLGTEFNVSAYPQDVKTEVVLLEGSVEVNTEESQRLKPNEKFTIRKETGNWEIEQVDGRDYISWTNGVLWFKNENFHEIVPKLERHYNVKISNDYKGLENKTFTGRFETEGIQEVLEVFKIATNFEYEISENEISIHQPELDK